MTEPTEPSPPAAPDGASQPQPLSPSQPQPLSPSQPQPPSGAWPPPSQRHPYQEGAQGWGPPPPSGPGWPPAPGAWPPASQPGYAAPQPAYGAPQAPPQGWPQPYPGQGYGATPRGRWKATAGGWVWVPESNSFVGRHKVAIILGGIAVAVILLVGACVAAVWPSAMAFAKIGADSRVASVDYRTDAAGQPVLVVHTRAGYSTPSDGADIACSVVRPAIQGTMFANSRFEVVDANGNVLADNNTGCSP